MRFTLDKFIAATLALATFVVVSTTLAMAAPLSFDEPAISCLK